MVDALMHIITPSPSPSLGSSIITPQPPRLAALVAWFLSWPACMLNGPLIFRKLVVTISEADRTPRKEIFESSESGLR